MTFLPMVDRELREGSRRRGTYWLRVRVAIQAILIGVAGYVVNQINPSVKMGTVLFWGLSGIAMLFCLLAGRRSTADCLSREKREGTLGLLFLTDLKGYDVVLGKLAATSISSFYALMAVFPVLAIPLLTGGMTNGELWRMALALGNTFFFSVAIGLFASAVSREYRAAMAVNFLLALLLAGVPAGCGMGIGMATNRGILPLFYSCPVFSFVCCEDTLYGRMARDFWYSVALIHALAWLLVLLACWIVPRAWGDKPAPGPSRKWRWRNMGAMISYGSRAGRAAFRKKALDTNAFFWLAARARLKPAQVWTFLAVGAVWWFCGWFKYRAFWLTDETFCAAGMIVNTALKLWIMQEAGQRLGEDRRSGAFELLLATPLTVRDFLRGQMLALRRQFLKPLLVVTALELVLVLALKHDSGWKSSDTLACLAFVGMLWVDIIALVWVAMAAALTCKTQTQAAVQAVGRIFVVPWVVFVTVLLVLAVCSLMELTHWEPDERFTMGWWFGLGLAADLIFGLRAWHLLRKHFRRLAAQSFLQERPRSIWKTLWLKASAGAGTLLRRFIPPRARKPGLACLAAAVALAAVLLLRSNPHYPPPVLVSITQSNAPLKIFPAGGNGVFFVMPDGTLWRWGQTGGSQSLRAAVPEQIGAARNWVKAVGTGIHNLGVRADGTVWGWGFSNGRFASDPQPVLEGHDWIDAAIGQHGATALKKDGTLWTWNEPVVAQNPNSPTPLRGEPGSNWTAVACITRYGAIFALRSDGTLWAWGSIIGFANGGWMSTNISDPELLCADTNWVALDANLTARNRAGELWNAQYAVPNATAGTAAVLTLVSSNGTSDRVQSVGLWMRPQVRANGTLWAAILHPPSKPAPLPEDWRQLGARTNWTAVWGQDLTGFALTADGVLWTWGADLGKEPVKDYPSRLQLLRDRLTGSRGSMNATPSQPYSAQPRPLLRLIEGQAGPRPNHAR